jgi:hypothetical protein
VVSIKFASPAGAWGGGDDRNAPNSLWLIERRVRSDGTLAHPRGFSALDGSSDAGLSEVREDSFLWVAISPLLGCQAIGVKLRLLDPVGVVGGAVESHGD